MSALIRVLVLTALMLLGCGANEPESPAARLPGSWEAETAEGRVVLVLQEDGKGVWRTELDEAPFRWSMKGERLVLHTRSGGAVAASLPSDGTLRLNMPGVGELLFSRTERK